MKVLMYSMYSCRMEASLSSQLRTDYRGVMLVALPVKEELPFKSAHIVHLNAIHVYAYCIVGQGGKLSQLSRFGSHL